MAKKLLGGNGGHVGNNHCRISSELAPATRTHCNCAYGRPVRYSIGQNLSHDGLVISLSGRPRLAFHLRDLFALDVRTLAQTQLAALVNGRSRGDRLRDDTAQSSSPARSSAGDLLLAAVCADYSGSDHPRASSCG